MEKKGRTLVRIYMVKRTFIPPNGISAANGYGLDALKGAIETQLGRGKHHVKLLLPYQQGSMVAALHDTAQVLSSEYADNGIRIDAVLGETLFGKLRQYVIEEV